MLELKRIVPKFSEALRIFEAQILAFYIILIWLTLVDEPLYSDEKKNEKETKGKKDLQVPPRFELGSLDSESRVLTITPWDHHLLIRGNFI